MNSGIYTITSPSGHQYVGSAVAFDKRWRLHLINLRSGRHHCAPLQRAFDKYGENALRFDKVALVPRDELIAREQEQIDERGFENLYNLNPVAGSRLGAKSSDEHRARISSALKGRVMSPEWIQKLRDADRPPLSVEQRAKIGAAHKGRKATPESIAKRRQSRSSSPYPFVVFEKSRNKFIARPKVDGKSHNIGRFDTAERANVAVLEFMQRFKGD